MIGNVVEDGSKRSNTDGLVKRDGHMVVAGQRGPCEPHMASALTGLLVPDFAKAANEDIAV